MTGSLHRFSRLAFCVGLLTTLGAAPAQAQTTLRYKFKTSEKLHYVTEIKSEARTTIGDKDFTMTNVFTSDETWSVDEVGDDGSAKVVRVLNRIRFEQDGPQGKSVIDSEKPIDATDPLGQTLGPLFMAMVGAEFKATMSTQGAMSEWTFPEKVTTAMKKAPGGKLLEDAGKSFIGTDGQLLSKEQVKSGSTWEAKSQLSMAPVGKLVKNTKYTYEGRGAGDRKSLERIGFQLTLTADIAPKSDEQLKIVKQDGKGTAHFDNEKGHLVETSLVLKLEMEITNGDKTIPVKHAQTQSLKLVPAK